MTMRIDSFEQYTKLTGRTESIKTDVPYDTDITSEPIREQKIFALRFLHHSIGMTTEAGEMMENVGRNDNVNWIEEKGDGWWYISRMCEVMGIKMEDLNQYHVTPISPVSNINEIPALLAIESAQLMDCAKRFFYYGKPLNREKALSHISNYNHYLLRGCELLKISPFDVLQRNIDKLTARYPERFDSDKAVNRDLEAERKALQGE